MDLHLLINSNHNVEIYSFSTHPKSNFIISVVDETFLFLQLFSKVIITVISSILDIKGKRRRRKRNS